MRMLCKSDSLHLQKALDKLTSILFAFAHFGLCCEFVGSMMLCGVCCVRNIACCSENIVVFTSNISMEFECLCHTSVSLKIA